MLTYFTFLLLFILTYSSRAKASSTLRESQLLPWRAIITGGIQRQSQTLDTNSHFLLDFVFILYIINKK